jgi:integrase/recombinase XerD
MPGYEIEVIAPAQPPAGVSPIQARDDAHMIEQWLHGRPATTTGAYRADAAAFMAFVAKGLRAVTVGDVQQFADTLADLKPASIARKLSTVKSLLTYAHRLGYVRFNVGAAVRLPKLKDTLAEKIVDADDLVECIRNEPNARNAALLRLTYGAGLRVSEVVALRWRDLVARENAGQITVFGKGGKTRVVLLSATTWRKLQPLRGAGGEDDPVFRSAKGGHLDRTQVHRIVKAAAARAGMPPALSAHWLRHAHVSHALDKKVAVHLVQQTVGHASLATTSRYAHARPSDSSACHLGV